MRRRLFNFLTALSLLLCVAAAVMWVRSHFAQDFVDHSTVTATPAGFRWWSGGVATWRGVVRVGANRHEYSRAATPEYDAKLQELLGYTAGTRERKWWSRRAEDFPVMANHPLSRWGFSGQVIDESEPGHRGFVVGGSGPWWFVLLLCSVPVDLRIMAWLYRRRRHGRRRCAPCGYDLTGNVSGVCPECGARAV